VRRHQQYIIESKRFLKQTHILSLLAKSDYTGWAVMGKSAAWVVRACRKV
jgi:hypothetical protein